MDATEATIRRIRAIAAWLRQIPDELGDRDADAIHGTTTDAIFSLVADCEDGGLLQRAADAVDNEMDAVEQNADGTWPETFCCSYDEYWALVEAKIAAIRTK